MITKILSIITSLTVGGATLMGLAITPVVKDVQLQPTATPVVTGNNDNQNPGKTNSTAMTFRGDLFLIRGLMQATANITGLRPEQIQQAVQSGQSLIQIIESAGKTAQDIMSSFENRVNTFLQKGVDNGRITTEQAQKVTNFVQNAAPNVLRQSPLKPTYPGLPDLQRLILTASVQVGSLDKNTVRQDLQACQSLNDILTASGHTGQEAVDAAMNHLDAYLGRQVKNGTLTADEQQQWLASIKADLTKLVAMPGLGRAGKACTQ
jgi:hypothetical protein